MRIFSFIIAAILTVASAFSACAKSDAFTVVVDPGHGGHDSGCVGRVAKEKNIVLDVGKLLRDKIQNKYGKKVNVVMTRSTDKFVSLQGRADIANKAHGDLFISIHVNSVAKSNKKRRSLKGASTYTVGNHRTQSNLQVAMRENSVMELEPDHSVTYKGFDPSSSESYILFELSQNQFQRQSIKFAQTVQDFMVSEAGRVGKGVNQAGFWVLWATAMPSVLVELDFICNPTQEDFLNSKKGKEKCANALFKAFCKYYDNVKD